jgi:hypothetical protein
MLMDSISGAGNADLVSTIQAFVNRTAMLRVLEFPHFSTMLAEVVSTGLSHDAASVAVLAADAASLSQSDAQNLGRSFAASLRSAVSAAAAADEFVHAHPMLLTICNTHAWLKPLFEVLAERMLASPVAKLRRMTRASSAFRDRGSFSAVRDAGIGSLRRSLVQVVPETGPYEAGIDADNPSRTLTVRRYVTLFVCRQNVNAHMSMLMLAYVPKSYSRSSASQLPLCQHC